MLWCYIVPFGAAIRCYIAILCHVVDIWCYTVLLCATMVRSETCNISAINIIILISDMRPPGPIVFWSLLSSSAPRIYTWGLSYSSIVCSGKKLCLKARRRTTENRQQRDTAASKTGQGRAGLQQVNMPPATRSKAGDSGEKGGGAERRGQEERSGEQSIFQSVSATKFSTKGTVLLFSWLNRSVVMDHDQHFPSAALNLCPAWACLPHQALRGCGPDSMLSPSIPPSTCPPPQAKSRTT